VADRLFNLLPAIYRVRDAEAGRALQGLLSVADHVLEDLEEDIRRLYDDFFIETCEDWVVPYIGDLLAVPVRHTGWVDKDRLRRFIARTVTYRRSKGTASVLARLTSDLTGLQRVVVREGITMVAWNQQANHVRPDRKSMIDLRDRDLIGKLRTPLDRAFRTVDLRMNPDSAVNPRPDSVGLAVSIRNPQVPDFEREELRYSLAEYLPVGMKTGIDFL
jgi:phage tail-like protein